MNRRKNKTAPFPQANNLDSMFSILFDIGKEGIVREEVIDEYGLTTVRQGAYYLNALLFLGLVEKINVKYFLTQKGVDIRLASRKEAKKLFINAILNVPIIETIYNAMKSVSDRNKKSRIVSRIISESYGLNEVTSDRRASTVLSWFEWIEINKVKE